MRAVQFLGDREAVVIDKPDPTPGPGQAVVRMVRAAVCGSDLHGYRRPRAEAPPSPLTPGHEPVGVVVQVGSGVDQALVGQRVLVYHRPGCGVCPQCLAGCSNICSGTPRPRVDGSDADYQLCFAERLFVMPATMDWETAVVISCQAGTAYAPLTRVGASGRSIIVVSGLGPVGLCAVMLGQAMGATIVGIDPMAERRALGTRFGATAVLDPAAGSLTAQVADLARDGADAVIETSGNPAAQAAAVDLLRVEGTLAFVGLGSNQPSIAPARLFGRQLSAYGSNLYPQRMLPEIFDFVERRRVPLADIITHRFPLSEAPAAFRLADSATTGKIVFAWD
ncbi:MAG: zinc-binding dehydrogenase [Chloroflexi bacterium]|nr:zinc-binding dehydrogenase [Chloroflexota bacterium]